MLRYEAWGKAHDLFSRRAERECSRCEQAVGDRYAFSSLGRKSDPDRYRVGYDEVVRIDTLGSGRFAKTKRVLLGAGPTWEVALERAEQKMIVSSCTQTECQESGRCVGADSDPVTCVSPSAPEH